MFFSVALCIDTHTSVLTHAAVRCKTFVLCAGMMWFHFFRSPSFSKCKTKSLHELILLFLSFSAIVCLRFISPFFFRVAVHCDFLAVLYTIEF
jgi:uncharacterized membrane protein